MAPRSTNLVFTLNNYTDVEVQAIRELPTDATVRFVAYGREIGENGTPHLQGVLVFKTKKTVVQAHSYIPRAHFEIARGTFDQAYLYVKKGEQSHAEWEQLKSDGPTYGLNADVFEAGDKPMAQKDVRKKGGEGEKKKWQEVKQLAISGDIDAIDPSVYVRYYNTLKNIAKDHMQKPNDLNRVSGVWISGPSGVGKSRAAREVFGKVYDKMPNKWWDGYQNEPVVLIDDLDTSHDFLAHNLKRWADRYSFVCEAKGNAREIRPKVIVVTSQYTIDDIWPLDKPAADAIKRRFIRCPIILSPEAQAKYDAVYANGIISPEDNVDLIDEETFNNICESIRLSCDVYLKDLEVVPLPDDVSELSEAPTLLDDIDGEPLDGDTIKSDETVSDDESAGSLVDFLDLSDDNSRNRSLVAFCGELVRDTVANHKRSRHVEEEDEFSLFDNESLVETVKRRRIVDLSDDE